MALKRKASFTTITSPSATATTTTPLPPALPQFQCLSWAQRQSPSTNPPGTSTAVPGNASAMTGLMSKAFTRKQSSAAQSGHTNNLDNIISPPAAEIPQQSSIDPNQQTLQRFFQPVRASSHCPIQSHCSSKKVMHPPTQPLAGNGVSISHSSSGGSGSSTSASAEGTGVHTTGTRYIDMDIDMDVDMDVGCYAGIEGFVPVAVSMASTQGQWEYEEGKRWVGGIGWM
ncbi:hypothetical protein ACJ72_05804 [Emergomyces africanus]|uniref:Uncharacterized protein n=1 Tax=Emergomyces africanus TaxID=1955775 RepID=A0A1B7NST8_9EURO|nr:hypothetical protein ACJ72_05804 [Emergomyces africanus]